MNQDAINEDNYWNWKRVSDFADDLSPVLSKILDNGHINRVESIRACMSLIELGSAIRFALQYSRKYPALKDKLDANKVGESGALSQVSDDDDDDVCHSPNRTAGSAQSQSSGAQSPFGPSTFIYSGPVSDERAVLEAALKKPKKLPAKKRYGETLIVCHFCGATETPEWRKGPSGARTLCNACGLQFAKRSKKGGSGFFPYCSLFDGLLTTANDKDANNPAKSNEFIWVDVQPNAGP